MPTSNAANHDLLALTQSAASNPSEETRFQEWRAACHAADVKALIEATARLSSDPGKRTRDIKAMREAVIAEIDLKNAEAVIGVMQKLDASANRLTAASLFLTLVGVVLAAIQVLEAIR